MTTSQRAIATKAVRNMIKDLKSESLFDTFEDLSDYVKLQFKNKTVIAKSYIKEAMG